MKIGSRCCKESNNLQFIFSLYIYKVELISRKQDTSKNRSVDSILIVNKIPFSSSYF